MKLSEMKVKSEIKKISPGFDYQKSIDQDKKPLRNYKKKKATRGSIRGIKTFLDLPEDHTRGATIYSETQDIIDYLTKCINETYWD